MKDALTALLALQQLDIGLAKLQSEYAALDRGDAEKATLEEARREDAAATDALHRTRADLKDAELELQTTEQKRMDTEARLYGGSVRAAKELQALQDEVEMLARRRERLDESILALMDEVEARQAAANQSAQRRAEAEQALAARQTQHRLAAERMVAEARTLAAERAAAAKAVAPGLLKQYESLRVARGGLAAVPLIEGGACGGCRMALPSSFVEQVRFARSVCLCENCGRIVIEP